MVAPANQPQYPFDAPIPAGPPPPKRRPLWPWLVAFALLGVCLLAVLFSAGNYKPGSAPPAPPTATDEAWRHATVTPTTDPAVAAPAVETPVLKASDLKLTPKITDKQCFGSAGCSVTFKVKVAYSGPLLSDQDTWEVTYQVTGVEDGPMIGSFQVTGDQYQVNEEFASTSSSSKAIVIKVTSVDKIS